eukprot:366095-Chlamydomonas_euryale.AAC.18
MPAAGRLEQHLPAAAVGSRRMMRCVEQHLHHGRTPGAGSDHQRLAVLAGRLRRVPRPAQQQLHNRCVPPAGGVHQRVAVMEVGTRRVLGRTKQQADHRQVPAVGCQHKRLAVLPPRWRHSRLRPQHGLHHGCMPMLGGKPQRVAHAAACPQAVERRRGQQQLHHGRMPVAGGEQQRLPVAACRKPCLLWRVHECAHALRAALHARRHERRPDRACEVRKRRDGRQLQHGRQHVCLATLAHAVQAGPSERRAPLAAQICMQQQLGHRHRVASQRVVPRAAHEQRRHLAEAELGVVVHRPCAGRDERLDQQLRRQQR